MKKLSTLMALGMLVSCSTTNINKIKKLPPLTSETAVQVFIEEPPTFGYEVICEAEVESKGDFTSTTPSGYKSKAEDIARRCGAPMAVIKSLTGFSYGSGANVTVQIEAGVRNTEDSRFHKNDETLKKLSTAIGVGNVKNVKAILSKLKVNAYPNKRAPMDNALLSFMMRVSAEKGKDCPVSTLDYLNKNLGVTINHFNNFKTGTRFPKENFVYAKPMMKCPSVAIVDSVQKSTDQEKTILAINNAFSEMVNGGIVSTSAKKNFMNSYPHIKKQIIKACQADKLSSLCSAKQNIERIRSSIK